MCINISRPLWLYYIHPDGFPIEFNPEEWLHVIPLPILLPLETNFIEMDIYIVSYYLQ